MKVAIVGSGCSGIGALWALKTTSHDFHLFEADARLGGRTNTVSFTGKNNNKIQIDTSFVGMSRSAHPNFTRFLDEIGMKTETTGAAFSVSRDFGDFEWSGGSVRTFFAQCRGFLDPRRWHLLYDVVRFNQSAVDLLIKESVNSDRFSSLSESQQQLSIGDFLARGGYSQSFKDDYVVPMAALVWGMTPGKSFLQFPALTLITSIWHHRLFSTTITRPDWPAISKGASRYIEAVLKDVPPDRVHVSTRITSVVREPEGKIMLRTTQGDLIFDHVILAMRADQALELIRLVATEQEINVLQNFKKNQNIAVLHSDHSLMPRERAMWSTCNFITESQFPPTKIRSVSKMCSTYWVNQFQQIPDGFGPVLITLNPIYPPATALTQGVWEYSYSVLDVEAVRSQKLLLVTQDCKGISYCGAWTGSGSHEDSFTSGLAVAQGHLGAKLPFRLVDSPFPLSERPKLTIRGCIARFVIQLIQLYVLFFGVLSSIMLNLMGFKRKT